MALHVSAQLVSSEPVPTTLRRFVSGWRLQAANLNSAIVDAVFFARRTIRSLQAKPYIFLCHGRGTRFSRPGLYASHLSRIGAIGRIPEIRGENRVGRPQASSRDVVFELGPGESPLTAILQLAPCWWAFVMPVRTAMCFLAVFPEHNRHDLPFTVPLREGYKIHPVRRY
jgi:hypothetical protein